MLPTAHATQREGGISWYLTSVRRYANSNHKRKKATGTIFESTNMSKFDD